MDDLESIRKVCDRHQMWLHAEGSSLLLAAATSSPPFVYSLFETADSVVASPLEWYDVESSALAVTFIHKSSDPHAQSAAGGPSEIGLPVAREDFSALFLLWYQLVTHKVSFLSDLVDSQLHAVRYFRALLAKQSFEVSMGPSGNTHPHLLFFQVQAPAAAPLSAFNWDRNAFNKYLWSRIVPRIRPEHALTSTSHAGAVGLLFHPLVNGAAPAHVSTGVIDQIVADLAAEVNLLDMAAKLRDDFKAAVSAQRELQFVPSASVKNMVGIGAFQLVPAFPIPTQQSNALNAALSHALMRANPALYALSMTVDNNVCTVLRTGPIVFDKSCIVTLVAEILEAAVRTDTHHIPFQWLL
jgi:hypothetical protein